MHELRTKKTVTLAPHEIEGCGINLRSLPAKVQKRVLKAYDNAKNVRISREDVFGSGFVNGQGFSSIEGEGLFWGKKGDRALKKLGVKKAVYSTGRALKPFVDEAIDNGVQSLSVAMPSAAPGLMYAGKYAKKYVENPDAERARYKQMGNEIGDYVREHDGIEGTGFVRGTGYATNSSRRYPQLTEEERWVPYRGVSYK